jgi:hypothetical protein
LDLGGWAELFVLLFDNCREWNPSSMNAQTRKLGFSDSYYDETKRRGWRHEVSCIQKGKVHFLPREELQVNLLFSLFHWIFLHWSISRTLRFSRVPEFSVV